MSDPSPKPLITTIIPTYRRPKLLRRAIRSVLAQTYPRFQVRVYDNNSGDETASVVEDLAKGNPQIKYFCHRETIEASRNFAYGMEHVETSFFSFLSDDDFLLPEFYQTALAGFEKHPEAIFSALLTLVVDAQARLMPNRTLSWKAGLYMPPEGLLAFLRNGFLTWTGMLFRREVIEKVGLLNPEVGGGLDTDYVLRIVPCFPFVVSSQPGAVFMVHPGSSAYRTRFDSIWPGLSEAIRKITQNERIPSDTRKYLESVLKKWHINVISKWCLQFILKKDFESAYKAANLLRDIYKLEIRAFTLAELIRACEHVAPVYWAGYYLNELRQFLLNFRLGVSRLPVALVRRLFHFDTQDEPMKLEDARTIKD